MVSFLAATCIHGDRLPPENPCDGSYFKILYILAKACPLFRSTSTIYIFFRWVSSSWLGWCLKSMSTGLVLQIKAMSLCPLSPLRGRMGGGAATDFFILTLKSRILLLSGEVVWEETEAPGDADPNQDFIASCLCQTDDEATSATDQSDESVPPLPSQRKEGRGRGNWLFHLDLKISPTRVLLSLGEAVREEAEAPGDTDPNQVFFASYLCQTDDEATSATDMSAPPLRRWRRAGMGDQMSGSQDLAPLGVSRWRH